MLINSKAEVWSSWVKGRLRNISLHHPPLCMPVAVRSDIFRKWVFLNPNLYVRHLMPAYIVVPNLYLRRLMPGYISDPWKRCSGSRVVLAGYAEHWKEVLLEMLCIPARTEKPTGSPAQPGDSSLPLGDLRGSLVDVPGSVDGTLD